MNFTTCFLAALGDGLTRHEATAALLGLLTLSAAAVWLLVQWIRSGPKRPDPWSDEVTAEMGAEECQPICYRCMAPLEASSQLCDHCGAIVGAQTSLIAPLYLYSIGEVFRAGVLGRYRRSPWLMAGYVIMGLIYVCFMGILGFICSLLFWYQLLNNPPQPAHPPESA